MKQIIVSLIFLLSISELGYSDTVIPTSVRSAANQSLEDQGWRLQKVANFGPTYDRRPINKNEKSVFSGVGSLMRVTPEGEYYSSAAIITPPGAALDRDFDILIASAHIFYADDCTIEKGIFEYRPGARRDIASIIDPKDIQLEYSCRHSLHSVNDRVAIKVNRISLDGMRAATLGYGSIDNLTAYEMQEDGEAKFYLVAYNPLTKRIEISDNCKVYPSRNYKLGYTGITTDCDCGSGCSGAPLVMEYQGTKYVVGTFYGDNIGDLSAEEIDQRGNGTFDFDNVKNYNLVIAITEGFADLIEDISARAKSSSD